MRIKIRNWDNYFEADRSRQWKSIKWVPIPNKQGLGYKKIMAQKNGAEIFGCWCALVQQGSLCDPRGDLSKYTILDISVNTMIPFDTLQNAINYIVQNLDWIEVIENLDILVNENDISVSQPAVGSSILCNSILCNSSLKDNKKKYLDSVFLMDEEYKKLTSQHGEENTKIFIEILDLYKDSKGKKYKSDYKAILSWVVDETKKRGRYKTGTKSFDVNAYRKKLTEENNATR
jgi:hypothetical protein